MFHLEQVSIRVGQTLRRLRHEWRYSAMVILVLGVGVGPTATITSVVYNVLLRPLDYDQPERLGIVRISLGQLRNHPGLAQGEVLDLQGSGIFERVEAETRLSEASFGTAPALVPVSQLNITVGMLRLLGVEPAMGRSFTEDDLPPPLPPRPPGPPPVTAGPPPPRPPVKVLLDYGFWQRHLGADRGIVGRLIPLNGQPAEVIGVLPNGFQLITGRAAPRRIEVYMPFRLVDQRPQASFWGQPTLVRLKPGTTFARAQAGLDALSATIMRDHATVYTDPLRFTVTPLLDDMTQATSPALRAAAAAVILLLLIALANATGLVIARLKAREPDLAIRSAMGARSGVLIGDVLIESVLLATAGAAVGGLLALAGAAGVRTIIPRTVPRWEQIGPGWDQLLYSSGLALVGLVLLGLIPAWRIRRGANFQLLRSGSVQGGRSEGTASRLALVGVQMALTVALAFACVQLARSAAGLRRVELGFDPNVLTFRVPYDFRRYGSDTARAELYQRIRDRVRQVPGVTAVGIVTHLPLSGSTMLDGYEADLSKEPTFAQSANYQGVTPGYFAALRIPILQGRDFTDAEDAGVQPVIIVDETLVRHLFPGQASVLGRTLRLGWGLPNAQIVGVVGHARTIEVGRAVRPQIYAPIGSLFQNAGNIAVRGVGDPRLLASAVTQAILDVGPGRAISSPVMLTENVTAATSTLLAITSLVTFFALSAGLLSAIGLYLVVSYVIHQRRRATAIRTALGASPQRVMWENVRSTSLLLCAALPAGGLLSLALAPFLSDLVYGVGSRDLLSLVGALVLAAVAGLLGTYVPMRKAANVNISGILRQL